ncbi:MAG: hypothetical protein JWL95_2889 [Gemmatimonadetes bacterium]|nr:hypothetical protein [Gemmatimonadota bacterium]
MTDAPVPARVRFLICMVLGIAAAHYVHLLATHVAFHRDVAQLWFAAREVLHGRNPYSAIGPGRTYEWPWPLYYPLPSVLAVIPISWLSEPLAVSVFAAVSIATFAWALAEHGYPPLLGMLSFSLWHAMHLVQWSPLLAAGLVIPWLSALWIVKPTIGAALFAARPTRLALASGAALAALSFIVQPNWVHEWLAAFHSANVQAGKHAGFFAIVQLPAGVLVLAALVRWRRPEARLLAVLSCVPQTLLPYESVLLLLIPRGWLESIAMTVLSFVMYYVAVRGGPEPYAARVLTLGHAVTLTMYLPATLMVLRRRNEGTVPAWLERRIVHWPAWIAGSPATQR